MLYLPFTKIDEEQRIVYGVASDETPDNQGDIVDYAATKKAVGDWQRWRNIREMHQPSAVGVAEEINLDDTAKSFSLAAKVVDDDAWSKVKAGVYKGFSIGGRVLASITQQVGGEELRRITDYSLSEISLVDRPANPSAIFSLVKMDGETAEENEEAAPPPDQEEEESDNPEGEQNESMAEAKNSEESSSETAESPPAWTPDDVRAIVVGVLEEAGLVRVQEQYARADEVADLQKVIGEWPQPDSLASAQSVNKISGTVAQLSGDLKKLGGDIAQVAGVVETLQTRLEKVEAQPVQFGPVLRELGTFSSTDVGVLQRMLADEVDPNTRQIIGQRIAELQLKTMYQSK